MEPSETAKKKLFTMRELVRQAMIYYPTSKAMRRQWIIGTAYLLNEGKHVLYGGEAKWGVPQQTKPLTRK